MRWVERNTNYLNTSHVEVNQQLDICSLNSYAHLNTSHVEVNPL